MPPEQQALLDELRRMVEAGEIPADTARVLAVEELGLPAEQIEGAFAPRPEGVTGRAAERIVEEAPGFFRQLIEPLTTPSPAFEVGQRVAETVRGLFGDLPGVEGPEPEIPTTQQALADVLDVAGAVELPVAAGGLFQAGRAVAGAGSRRAAAAKTAQEAAEREARLTAQGAQTAAQQRARDVASAQARVRNARTETARIAAERDAAQAREALRQSRQVAQRGGVPIQPAEEAGRGILGGLFNIQPREILRGFTRGIGGLSSIENPSRAIGRRVAGLFRGGF